LRKKLNLPGRVGGLRTTLNKAGLQRTHERNQAGKEKDENFCLLDLRGKRGKHDVVTKPCFTRKVKGIEKRGSENPLRTRSGSTYANQKEKNEPGRVIGTNRARRRKKGGSGCKDGGNSRAIKNEKTMNGKREESARTFRPGDKRKKAKVRERSPGTCFT